MKKLLVALVFCVFVLTMAAGCGQKEEAAAPVETPAAEEATMTEEEQVMDNMTTAEMEEPMEEPMEAPQQAPAEGE